MASSFPERKKEKKKVEQFGVYTYDSRRGG